MSWLSRFRKKKVDVVDLGLLQKRGIIKGTEIEEGTISTVADKISKDMSTETSGASALGFLGSLASAGESSGTNTDITESTADTSETSSYGSYDHTSYRKATLRNKLYKISQQLEAIEKRLERIERKTGIKSADAEDSNSTGFENY